MSLRIPSFAAAAVLGFFAAYSVHAQTVTPGFPSFNAGNAPSLSALPQLPDPRPSISVTSPVENTAVEATQPVPGVSGFTEREIISSGPEKPSVPVSGTRGPDDAENRMPPVGSALSGVPQFTTGSVFYLEGVPVRLSGVSIPPGPELCLTASGTQWQCGRSANTRLSMLFEGKSANCRVVRSYPSGVTAVCSSGTVSDVSRLMVSEGWAIPYGKEGRKYSSESLSAASSKSGLWSGNFSNSSKW